MKNLPQIKNIISNRTADMYKLSKAEKTYIASLRQVVLYLERNPSESCMEEQLALVEHELEVFQKRLKSRCFTTPRSVKPQNEEAYHELIYGIPRLKEQRRILKFILSDR